MVVPSILPAILYVEVGGSWFIVSLGKVSTRLSLKK
jgi:hypothetical protein